MLYFLYFHTLHIYSVGLTQTKQTPHFLFQACMPLEPLRAHCWQGINCHDKQSLPTWAERINKRYCGFSNEDILCVYVNQVKLNQYCCEVCGKKQLACQVLACFSLPRLALLPWCTNSSWLFTAIMNPGVVYSFFSHKEPGSILCLFHSRLQPWILPSIISGVFPQENVS